MVFDLSIPIRDAIASTRDDAIRRGIRVILSTPARRLWVDGDPASFRDTFRQRLVEAIDASADGGSPRIHVSCSGGLVRVLVGAEPMTLQLSRTPGGASTPVAGRLTGLKVLIADDNRDAANGLATLLRLAGAKAWAVFGGQVAVDEAIARGPDAVLLDLGMPGVNGFEAARRIRRHDPSRAMRLIAITGATRSIDRDHALAAGFDQCVFKPVDTAALITWLEQPRGPSS